MAVNTGLARLRWRDCAASDESVLGVDDRSGPLF